MLAEILSLLGVLTLGLLSPGPDFLVVVKNALGGSRAAAFATVAGIALGLVAQCVVIVFGFAAASPVALRAVQWIGAAFLAYVGLRALLAKPESAPATDVSGATMVGSAGAAARAAGDAIRRGFLEGLLCNLTNPKAFLFFVSLYAQFARTGNAEAIAFWRVAFPIVSAGHALVAWSLVVLAVQSPPVATRLRRAQRWLPRAFGAALLGLALWTAWSAL